MLSQLDLYNSPVPRDYGSSGGIDWPIIAAHGKVPRALQLWLLYKSCRYALKTPQIARILLHTYQTIRTPNGPPPQPIAGARQTNKVGQRCYSLQRHTKPVT